VSIQGGRRGTVGRPVVPDAVKAHTDAELAFKVSEQESSG